MLVTIRCPECNTTARVEDQMIGRTLRCRNCKTSFVAESTADAAPAKRTAPVPPRSSASVPAARLRPTRPADDDEEEIEERPRPRKKKRKKAAAGNGLYIGIGLAVGLLGMGVILALTLGGTPKPTDSATVQVAANIPAPASNVPVLANPAPPRNTVPASVPETKSVAPVTTRAVEVPANGQAEPTIAENDRKLFTVWNVQIRKKGGQYDPELRLPA